MRTLGAAIFLALSGLAAPMTTDAQQPAKVHRIGYLSLRAGPSHLEEAFRQGLRELGYTEGKNIAIEYRWANLKPDRLPDLAAELARLQVDVIVSTGGNITALAARNATRTIPIVFTAGDPVAAGVVPSLARPGGNLTGVNLLTTELNGKRLSLLKEAVPRVSRVAVLANPTSPVRGPAVRDVEAAARSLGVRLHLLDVRDPSELDNAFSTMTKGHAAALLVLSDAMFLAQRERIVALAAKSRLPAAYEWREFVEAGGLMSYGTNLADMYRRLATYVDKLLKGAKPADLPVEQPTRFELVVNVKTAKTLGLTFPQSILVRADQVIE